MFVRAGPWRRLVHFGSLGRTLGVVGFIWARPGGRRGNSVSLGSLGHALGFVGFIRFPWVH